MAAALPSAAATSMSLSCSPSMEKMQDEEEEEEEEEEEKGGPKAEGARITCRSLLTCGLVVRWVDVLRELSLLLNIATPMMCLNLLWYSRVVISTAFVGHLGESHLAACALAVSIANVTGYTFLYGLASGMDPICGQAYGAANFRLLGLTLQRAILMLLCASAVIVFGVWMHVDRLLLRCGQDAVIASMAMEYIVCLVPDLIAVTFISTLRSFLRSQCIAKPMVVCAIIAVTLHIPLTYSLIHSVGLGYRGAAAAMVITDFVFAGLLLGLVWWSGAGQRSWPGMSAECLTGWSTLLKLALPSCFSIAVVWWTYEAALLASGLFTDPEVSVGAMGILLNSSALLAMIPFGINMAVATRVGIELGAQRPAKACLAGAVSWALGVVVGILVLVVTTFGRFRWARLFTDDLATQEAVSAALPLVGLSNMWGSPQDCTTGILRGCGRPGVALIVNFVSFYALGIPAALYFGFGRSLAVNGLWVGLMLAQLSAMIGQTAICVHKIDWVYEARRARVLTARDRDDVCSLSRDTCQESRSPVLSEYHCCRDYLPLSPYDHRERREEIHYRGGGGGGGDGGEYRADPRNACLMRYTSSEQQLQRAEISWLDDEATTGSESPRSRESEGGSERARERSRNRYGVVIEREGETRDSEIASGRNEEGWRESKREMEAVGRGEDLATPLLVRRSLPPPLTHQISAERSNCSPSPPSADSLPNPPPRDSESVREMEMDDACRGEELTLTTPLLLRRSLSAESIAPPPPPPPPLTRRSSSDRTTSCSSPAPSDSPPSVLENVFSVPLVMTSTAGCNSNYPPGPPQSPPPCRPSLADFLRVSSCSTLAALLGASFPSTSPHSRL